MAKVGEIRYKITDNLYIYNNGKADFLVYLNLVPFNIGNKQIVPNEDILLKSIENGYGYEYILNMNDVENSVSKSLKPYIEALKRRASKEMDFVALYLFLLRLKFYMEYIGNTLLEKELFDQYNKLSTDNNFMYILVDYLLNKRKSEQILQKWELILKNNITFNKLYEIMYKIEYIERQKIKYIEKIRDILHHYEEFKETLANVLKLYQQNTNIQTKA